MTYDELLAMAKDAKDRVFLTTTGKEFTVGVYMDCPFFVPVSTGLGRSDGRRAVERFLERYNKIQSVRPSDYQDVTRNASYLVALVQQGEPR